jgi:hypothetical protein
MKINLRRFLFEDNTTLGMLHIDNVFECWTLEDLPRDQKIMHETAIPTGVYRIELTDKNKWGKIMPHVQNVPNFQGIYIHSGNTKEDTSGCILVADQLLNPSRNAGSKIAFDRLMVKLRKASDDKEDIFLSVENYHSVPV